MSHAPDPFPANPAPRVRARGIVGAATCWALAMAADLLTAWTTSNRLAVGTALATVLAVAMAVRRLAPSWVGIGATASVIVGVVAAKGLPPASFLALPAVYAMTRWGHGALAYSAGPMAGVCLLWLLGGARVFGEPSTPTMAALLTTCGIAVWGWGLGRRRRADRLRDAARRDAAGAREREQLAELAAASERTRIAREMHDIVAHSLSVVIAQADGGLYASRAEPEAATKALATIAETGRAALADMRRILGVLRHPEEAEAGALRAPVPDSQDLAALVEQMREAGMEISMVRIGVGTTLPPGLGLALYRICQEGLTNALKHAGPAVHVTVIDRWEPHQITIELRDDGRGAAATSTDGPGHGLVGMRERVEMFGGTLEAGPSRGGGFTVSATIPLSFPTPPATPSDKETPTHG